MTRSLLIGNAQGFWGDRIDAPRELLTQFPKLDYLTLNYLAEISLSILAVQKEKEPDAGYAKDFVDVVASLIPFLKARKKTRIITNAGGLNPEGCARACAALLQQEGVEGIKIAVIQGDNVLPSLKRTPESPLFRNQETDESVVEILDLLLTANAYLGAAPLLQALETDAQLIITGALSAPSMLVAPCLQHFAWSPEDYTRIAGATVAGQLIQSGTQVTGGLTTNWLALQDPVNLGYPVVEIEEDGTFTLYKAKGSGGVITEQTIKEQLLYEIGDPQHVETPDVTLSLLNLGLEKSAQNRYRLYGAEGSPPPPNYYVDVTYTEGYSAQSFITIFGRHAVEKARRSGEIILQRLHEAGFQPEKRVVECLGSGSSVPVTHLTPEKEEIREVVLRVAVADKRYDVVQRFTREISPLITSGPQGITGYLQGRPRIRPLFGHWPCRIVPSRVIPHVKVIEVTL